MSIKDTLLEHMKEAMKTKDTVRKDTIQIVRAGVLQVEKDNKIELDDVGVVEIIQKELKKRQDVLPDYEKSGRQDSINEIQKQMEILKSYLPEQLSENELVKIVNETITEVNAISPKDIGKVMQAISPKVKGRADNKLVSEVIKRTLKEL